MPKAPAIFTKHSPATEQQYRQCIGNFRNPPPTFSPSQISAEMALAACGILYLDRAEQFSRNAIKHVAYLHEHMHIAAKPTIVLAFGDSVTTDQGHFFTTLFKKDKPFTLTLRP